MADTEASTGVEQPETYPLNARITRVARDAIDEIAARRGLRFAGVVVETLAREELARLRAAGGVP